MPWKSGEWSDGLALEASTEMGAGQLVQICTRWPGCIAVVEGLGGQNGANGMVKRSIGGGIERNYAGKRVFDALNGPNECHINTNLN